MKLTLLTALLISAASAREFVLYDDSNFQGFSYRETRNNDAACWNLNGKGDRTSSVAGDDGCTSFFRQRDCQGDGWQQRRSARTVPAWLNDHIESFRNQC